jgi:four helix bundle protein
MSEEERGMKRCERNSKAEGRRKSEGRGPKEVRRPRTKSPGSPTLRWEYEIPAEGLFLREEGPTDRSSPEPLGERTARFGERIVEFAKRIPQNPVNSRLIAQLVGSGTSVGANYCEADDAVSGKEFKQKIGICRKESKETMFFLRMIATAEPGLTEEARTLWREAKELNLIFGAIWRK